MAADKQHAHQLLDRLDPSQLPTAVRFLEFMLLDPVSRAALHVHKGDAQVPQPLRRRSPPSPIWQPHRQRRRGNQPRYRQASFHGRPSASTFRLPRQMPAVPFAFAMGSLITRQLGDNWIRTTRRWTMVPWMLLGTGIILGGHWAYEVLGWGGYWGWDPVENASLLPWLAGTAFLHSVMIQEKRGMLKVWNIVLIMVTFFLSIFGTFLTRSGIVSSVHAFAQSDIGPFFAVFLGIIALFSLTLLFLRLDYLRSENKLDSVVSRESGFLFNNWILLASVFAVLWGTVFPILSKAVENQTVTVGAPFFNKVMTPIGLLLLFLTGAGPLLAWRKTSFQSIRRNFTLPLAVAGVGGAILFALGVRQLYAWMTIFLCIFVAVCIVAEFYKGARTRQLTLQESFAQAIYNLTLRNTRRYGGYVIHLGIVLLFVGFTGQAFKTEAKGLLQEGDLLRAKGYLLRCESLTAGENPNYAWQRAMLSTF